MKNLKPQMRSTTIDDRSSRLALTHICKKIESDVQAFTHVFSLCLCVGAT